MHLQSVFFLLALLYGLQATAQQSSSINIYSDQQTPFFLFVNGQQIHGQPVSNIRVSGLLPAQYQITVAYANQFAGRYDFVLDVQEGRELTYAMSRNQFGQYQPIFVSEVALNFVPPAPNMITTVMYGGLMGNQNPIGQPIQPQPPVGQPWGNPGNPQPPVFNPLPNYNGQIGCPNPITEDAFRDIRSSISSKTFESSKMTIAKQIARNNCFLSSQVRDLVGLFTYESDKLEIAKFVYPFTYDQGNYFRVNDAFEFESSIDNLDAFINGR